MQSKIPLTPLPDGRQAGPFPKGEFFPFFDQRTYLKLCFKGNKSFYFVIPACRESRSESPRRVATTFFNERLKRQKERFRTSRNNRTRHLAVMQLSEIADRDSETILKRVQHKVQDDKCDAFAYRCHAVPNAFGIRISLRIKGFRVQAFLCRDPELDRLEKFSID